MNKTDFCVWIVKLRSLSYSHTYPLISNQIYKDMFWVFDNEPAKYHLRAR